MRLNFTGDKAAQETPKISSEVISRVYPPEYAAAENTCRKPTHIKRKPKIKKNICVKSQLILYHPGAQSAAALLATSVITTVLANVVNALGCV